MSYPVDKIVTVNTFIEAGGLGFVNFGKAAAMAKSEDLVASVTWTTNTFKTITSASDALNWFKPDSESYYMCVRWFANRGGDLYYYLRDSAGLTTPIEDAADALGKKWFYNLFWTKDVYESQSDMLALADWADSEESYLWPGTTDLTLSDALLAKGNRHISVFYRQPDSVSEDPTQIYWGHGMAAEFSKVNYSGLQTSITGEFKSVIGTIAEDLSPTEITDLTDKKTVMYTITEEGDQTDRGVVINSWSMSSYGEFIDDVINIDALASALRVTLYNVFRASKKVGLTPQGQAQMISAANGILKQYYNNGVLGAGMILNPLTGEEEYCQFGFKIYTTPEDILTLADADKRQRKMYPLNCRVNLARAGHSIVVDLTVQ